MRCENTVKAKARRAVSRAIKGGALQRQPCAALLQPPSSAAGREVDSVCKVVAYNHRPSVVVK